MSLPGYDDEIQDATFNLIDARANASKAVDDIEALVLQLQARVDTLQDELQEMLVVSKIKS